MCIREEGEEQLYIIMVNEPEDNITLHIVATSDEKALVRARFIVRDGYRLTIDSVESI